MSNEKKNEDEIKSLLMTIFHEDDVKGNELLPIVKSSENIEKIFYFLIKNNNDSLENNQKNIQMISILTFLLKSNVNLIPLFMTKNWKNKISFLDCLTDIYLNENIDDHDKLIIESLIRLINKNYTLQKSSLEYIYQSISQYFRNEGNKPLTEQLLLKYFKLLNIYYTGKSKSMTNQSSEQNKINVCKEIKKYIYFNGMNSGMQMIINKNSINPYSDYPTLEEGCSFSFWINMDNMVIENYFKILPKNIFINFINIIIGGRQIILKLKNIDELVVSIDENESNTINMSTCFIYNEWNKIIFIMDRKLSDKKINLKIYINDSCKNLVINLNKPLNIKDKIESIILFENFLGKLTSVIFFSFAVDNRLISYFSSISGFYKNKYLFNFLQSLDNDYYSKNLKTKNEKSKSRVTNFKILLKEQNLKNLVSCFCPFTYDKHKNIIDDIFGNFTVRLKLNDGVNNYKNKTKNIKDLGGINNLLPIIELMISTLNNNINYNLVNKNILTEKTFQEFLSIINIILTKNKKNIIDANTTNFFACLSIFLEKIPGHLYTPNILNTIVKIGHTVMNENFDEEEKKLFNLENNYKYNYLNTILVNEKIISKFSLDNQMLLWSGVHSICINEPNLIKDFFNISKISLLLRFYDEKRYEEYCCSRHASFFKEDKLIKIMEPEMSKKVSKLFEIIQLFINTSNDNNMQNLNLFKLLSLDLSPCLQKKIINVYISYFSNDSIPQNSKLITLENLLKNNYFDLSEYILSISLLDIRIDIMKLFKIFMGKYKTNLENYLQNNSIKFSQILVFMSNNLLPNNLFVEIENNINNINNANKINEADENIINTNIENNNSNILPLTNFLNKTEYDGYLSIFWNLFVSWTIQESNQEIKTNSNLSKSNNIINNKKKTADDTTLKKKDKIPKLHRYILNFCIDFTSKTSSKFINEFLVNLISIMQNDNINRKAFYESRRFYPWLIDTIFFYYNIENKAKIDDQMYINSIKTQSLTLLGLLFSHRRLENEIIQKIDYILEYSYYYKDKKFNNNSDEIIRITRLILEKILKSSDKCIDIITRFCFEFMFLYKNNKKLFAIKNAGLYFRKNKEIQEEFLEITKTDDNSDIDISINTWEKIDGVNLEPNNSNPINNSNSNRSISCSYMSNSLNALRNSSITSINDVSNLKIIPEYFYVGINYNNIEKNNINNLDKIWSDFVLYDKIISYYKKNLWGTELLCTKIKINYDSSKFLGPLIKELIRNYGDNKNNKNILNDDIIKLLRLNQLRDKEIIKKDKKLILNLLNVNLILLCLSLEISKNLEEKTTLKRQLEEFLLYCILVSINISSTNIYFSDIQKIINDILGYSFIFLKKSYPKIYDEVLDYLISPIFEQIIIDQRRKNVFTSAKKNNYQNTSVYKLFNYSIVKNDKNNNNFRTNPSNRKITCYNNKSSSNINNETQSKRKLSIDNIECSKLKEKIVSLSLKGDPNIFIAGVIDNTLNYYKSERAQNAQNDILKFYSHNNDDNKMINNNNINNNDDKLEEKISDEKIRVKKSIKKLIPFFGNEIEVYSNNSALNEIKIRCFYKKNKKKLFSWNGFWSDKNLFFIHPEYLKLKIKNHFTKNMTKIILTPIYDVEYYLPDFSKFDQTKLFNDGDYKYKIHLNVDEILNTTNQNNNINNNNNNMIQRSKGLNDNNLILIKKNKWGFNYLQTQYKYFFEDLWDIYKKYYERKINFDKIILKNKETFDILIQTKLLNVDKIQSENLYFCCIVKPTHHIKGYISTECDSIKFTHCSEDDENENILENDPSYDKDMKSCFGSTFKCHKKDKEKVCTEIVYNEISYMFQKKYFYQETGIEIYTLKNKSYFLNFKNKTELFKFINDVLDHANFIKIKCTNYKGKKEIGYMKNSFITDNNKDKKLHTYDIISKMEEWQNWKISTLEYLMWLNIYSGRSFNDLTQYPILPWLITNYEKDEIEKSDYRDLSIPMGMLDINEKAEMRKETFIDFYNTLKTDLKENFPDFNYQDFLKKNEDYLEYYNNKKNDNNIEYNQIPYFFGSHYSNPTYVSHFLTRLFPFCSLSIEIHGNKFDDVNRIFISLIRTFETASTLKDDVRELIPEFYTLPEMFLNKNNLNLAQNKLDSEGKKITIHDVELPPWSNNISYNFITEMRKILEKNDLKINKWVDLIFGNLQRGEKAEENNNIFMAQTYENMIKIDGILNEDSRNALMRLVEVGVTPSQIFKNETKMRQDFNIFIKNKGKFLYESSELKCIEVKSNNYDKLNNFIYKKKDFNKEYRGVIYPKIIKIVSIIQNEIKIICNNNLNYNIKINTNKTNSQKYKCLIEESSIQEIENISSKYSPSYQISNLNSIPIIIYGNNKYMIKAGFWDNHIEINSLFCNDNSEKLINNYIFIEEGPIIVMEMSSDEKMLLCGTKNGYLIYFEVNKNILKFKKSICTHNDEINSISINNTLNMFATSSLDGYVMIRVLPSFDLVRSIKVNISHNIFNFSDDEFFYANNVFLSSSPLPCIIFYVSSKRIFKSYTINGEFIGEIQETNDSNLITCYKMFISYDFFDYIIYGTDDGYIKIRSFPDMNLINSIKPDDCHEIISIEISQDKKYCYAWSNKNKIFIITDNSKDESINKDNNDNSENFEDEKI